MKDEIKKEEKVAETGLTKDDLEYIKFREALIDTVEIEGKVIRIKFK